MTTLIGGRIGDKNEPNNLIIADGLIEAIGPKTGGEAEEKTDVEGLMIGPGLIDLQINGAYGEDFTTDPDSIWRVGARLPEQGVTAFLPTIITSPPETAEAAIAALDARPGGYRGAEPLGLHLEGPMLSPQRPGVHDMSLLRSPSADVINGWTSERGVQVVTLAPELEGAEPVVRALHASGVVVSAGHSAADYDQAGVAFGWGVSAVTHLFNAMEPFGHRAPGLIGATFDSEDVIAGMIVDGFHSHPAAVRTAWRLLGPERLALITDAMAAAGMGDGRFELGGATVEVSHGRVTDASGRLAGSTLTLDQAVRNLVAYTGCAPYEAVLAASSVPSRLLGLPDRGEVRVGARADLTLFDSTMRVVATIIGGDMVWQS